MEIPRFNLNSQVPIHLEESQVQQLAGSPGGQGAAHRLPGASQVPRRICPGAQCGPAHQGGQRRVCRLAYLGW